MKTEQNKGDHQFNCHVTAVFEGENIWLFFSGLQKIGPLAKSQLQCYLQWSFFFNFILLWICLETS